MTGRNKAIFNMDRKRAKKIGKLPESVVLTKPVLACLFPLTIQSCCRLAGNRSFTTIEFARSFLRNKTIDKKTVISVFQEGESFKRLAENIYETKEEIL